MVRELLTEALAEGVDLGMSPEEAQRARWHGAKSTITSSMMHLELGERAIRFSGNWRSAVEAMPDRYFRESQVMVLKAQEEALKFIRAGGDLGVLEGIPVGRGGEQHFNVDITEAAHRMRSDAARMEIKGLAPADVAPELSSREVSLGAMAAAGDLDSEKGDMEQANDFEAVLDRQPEPSDESLDLSTGETSDSEAGIYLTHFVQVSRTSHVLHKPREGEPGKAWCGTGGKAPCLLQVGEALGRKTNFCARCFGAARGCSKLCTHTKRVTRDGEIHAVRCMRRCDLGCNDLGRYLDEDDRLHLCEAHGEAVREQAEE